MTHRIEVSRRRFERSLDALNGSLEEEIGRGLRWSRWIVPVVGAAVGLAIGIATRRSLPRRIVR